MLKSRIFFLIGIIGLIALLASACASGVTTITPGDTKEAGLRFLIEVMHLLLMQLILQRKQPEPEKYL